MRTTYRVLAWLIVVGVAVQAAAIAYAYFGLGAWIQGGGVLDKATMESEASYFPGVEGFIVHGIGGEIVVPALALILLVVAFFAKVSRGVLFATSIVVLIVLQVLLGFLSFEIPGLGILHGVNALAIAVVAVLAARRASPARAAVAEAGERATAPAA